MIAGVSEEKRGHSQHTVLDFRCDCFEEGHLAPKSQWKGEGNTSRADKINKIRLTTVRQLGVHVKEDKDRTSTQARGSVRGREGNHTLLTRCVGFGQLLKESAGR